MTILLCNNYHQHNLCCDNCHSHVAMCLNKMSYGSSTNWNMIVLAFLFMFKGSFVRFQLILKSHLYINLFTQQNVF